MPTKFQLRGVTLEGLHAKILSSYPAGTRLVEAHAITEGGIAGFFTRTIYEAVIEVPDPAPAGDAIVYPTVPAPLPAPAKPSRSQVPRRAGAAALLNDAGTRAATRSRAFDIPGIPDRSAAAPSEEGRPDRAIPAPLSMPGDTVLIVGVGADALATARSMAAAAGSSSVRTAGSFRVEGTEHLVGRQGLVLARAAAVIAGEALFIAFGLGSDGSLRANALAEMKADQVWIVVDATRKHSDTTAWLRKVSWATDVAALAVIGSQDTRTPASVNDFALPIGWIDGRKASRTEL